MRALRDFTPQPWYGVDTGRPQRDPEKVDVAALLPPGTRLARQFSGREVTFTAGARLARTSTVVADVREPLLQHEARLIDGRAPVNPDEVLVSPATADRLHVKLGETITPRGGPALTVVGLARESTCLDCERVVTAPGSALAKLVLHDLPPAATGPTYLVDLPDGVSAMSLWPDLAAHGIALTPREVYLHPPSSTGPASTDHLRAAAMTAVIAGLGLLEIVLLAGTAFAVGARRQTRSLGLVAASGGNARHVRRIVLAQGLVLGAIGAVVGVTGGAVGAVAAQPLWERIDNAEIVAWAYGPAEIAGAALIGLLSGLAAAVVPAVGAGRMRPVDALAEQFRSSRTARRRSAGVGAGLLVAGLACGLAGNRAMAGDFAAYSQRLEELANKGGYLPKPSAAGPTALIVGGAILLVAALVILAPVVIGGLARLGARLPLSLRLAVRDTARHRHRTGPATSAIAVAVAGSVVLAFLVSGSSHADTLQHVPSLPPHMLTVEPNGDDASARAAGAAAAAELPGGRAYAVRQPLRPPAKGESPDELVGRELYAIPGTHADTAVAGTIGIADDARLAELAAGVPLDAAARHALGAGEALVLDETLLHDGSVVIDSDERRVHLPGHLVPRSTPYTSLPSVLISPAVARRQGWELGLARMLVPFAAATPDQRDAAIDAADQMGLIAYVEEGPGAPDEGLLLAVAAIAAFVTLVGVAISVALSAAEGRADLATLAAVGAPPRRRRALAGGQALIIAGLGCVAGLVFGGFVAYTARATTGSPQFVVPWLNLAMTGIAVPLLAVLVATAFTPSRLPLVRRAT
jgi:putative ABC transport system permease protein